MTADPYWNHNVHYHPTVLAAVPEGCRTALDVGCGDGLLARKLATRAKVVTGVDRSPEMIRQARAGTTGAGSGDLAFLEADYLTSAELDEGGYEFISAVAVVHHTGFEDAIGRFTRLLAPGGRLVVVGLAYNKTWLDWVISGAGVPVSQVYQRLRGKKEGPREMPVEEPEMHWGEVRESAARLLPGSSFRRRILWRYVLIWEKPE